MVAGGGRHRAMVRGGQQWQCRWAKVVVNVDRGDAGHDNIVGVKKMAFERFGIFKKYTK